MAIAKVFSTILPQDNILRPITVNKKFVLEGSTLTDTSSGYIIWDAVHSNLITPVGTQKAANDPTNSFDGSYQHVIWKSIDSRFYRFPYDTTNTLEHSNKRFTYKFLNYSASILSLPYLDMGESIKPGSVEFTRSFGGHLAGNVTGNPAGYLTDDQNGNLYDPSIFTGSFPDRNRLVAYWGFNDIFNRFKYKDGTLQKSLYTYQSNVFDVDRPSYVYNVEFESGVPIFLTSSGMSAYFDNSVDSRIITEHRDDFNFEDDFSISFWIKNIQLGANGLTSTRSIITKNSFLRKTELGELEKYQNDLLISTLHNSSSIVYSPTNVYPYKIDFDTNNERLYFRRSNGIDTLELSMAFPEETDWTHVAAVKSGSNYYFYRQLGLTESTQTGSWVKNDRCFNKHCILFGSQMPNERSFYGNVDEIRFYNKALTLAELGSLGDRDSQSMYLTAVAGNIFYKSGNIVISGFDPKYFNSFNTSNGWTLKYRGTHTIYEREIFTRIKKNEFNLSQNPSVLQSYASDLLIPEMASGSLLPYFTEIGLYDDEKNLLAVAKMNQPIQLRDDVDLNVSIRFDC